MLNKNIFNWNDFVDLYDWEFDFISDDQKLDVEFYQSMVKEKGGTVLEIGCGTGRITEKLLPIAKSVTVVDSAPSFLERLRKRLKQYTNLEIVESNMLHLQLGKQFDTIILSYSTFQYFLTREAQLDALKVLKEHLNDDGNILIDISPYIAIADSLDDFTPYYEHYHPALNADIAMLTSYQVDPESKIQYWVDKYIIKYRKPRENQPAIEEFDHHLALKGVGLDEMHELCRSVGLAVVNVFGSQNKEPINPESNNWFFVIQKMNK
ncbi:MAG TPA: class I SAM-dependent methyltransferase [Candidatus Cloacimonadota bacterium]|nr:class I SAM-dependent methyltransferase [Candidatus Cloacimonadales bacterium]HPY96354.1 class I SAM-dependent methyltransferase [Candidatus Cloacimonadota bacterium]HQB40920.1 class I SAM-dependent methyltransferase [Candidatus Cloacimonadota bacterium]